MFRLLVLKLIGFKDRALSYTQRTLCMRFPQKIPIYIPPHKSPEAPKPLN